MAEEAMTRVSGKKTLAGSEKKPKEADTADLVTKERVPDSYITRIKARPMRKLPSLSDRILANNPSRRERVQSSIAHINYLCINDEACLFLQGWLPNDDIGSKLFLRACPN